MCFPTTSRKNSSLYTNRTTNCYCNYCYINSYIVSCVFNGECIGQISTDVFNPVNSDSPNLLTDVFSSNPNWGRGAMGLPRGESFNSSFQYALTGRHNGGSNVLFLDGRVKCLNPGAIANGNIMPNKPYCNENDILAKTGCSAYSGNPIAAGTAGTWQDGTEPAATVSPL